MDLSGRESTSSSSSADTTNQVANSASEVIPWLWRKAVWFLLVALITGLAFR